MANEIYRLIKDIIIPLAASGLGGYLAMLGAKKSIEAEFKQEREATKKSSMMELRMEVRLNLEILEYIGPGAELVRLSDSSWNNCKHILYYYTGDIPDIADILCEAYVEITKINNYIDAYRSRGDSVHPELTSTKNKVKDILKKAKEKLDTLLNVHCQKRT